MAIATELRPPSAEEVKELLVILEGAGRASPSASPAGGGVRRIKAVCTIERLDRGTETVTLKGPLGRCVTARLADAGDLPRLRIGDSVVVTYTEALAVALEKTPGQGDGAGSLQTEQPSIPRRPHPKRSQESQCNPT